MDCGRCHLEAQEGDAEAAAEEDAAMESAAGEEDGPDLAERQAQVHFEEDQLFGAEEASEVSHNSSFDTLPGSPQVVMHEEDEGVEETEKQKRKDPDFLPRSQSASTIAASDQMSTKTDKGPHRCMTYLEALSAVASRTQASHYAAALHANGGYDDKGMIGPKTTLDPAKVLRARISYGDKRTNARLAKALRMDSIYFDERIDTTVIRETAKTKVNLGRGVEEEAETFVQRTAKEEHCPVIMHGPEGEVYIETHKLEVGTGRFLADKLVKSLEKQQSKDTVKVIGSDSCSKKQDLITGRRHVWSRS